MGQFNITVSSGSAPYTVSVKKVGDNTERWISGGTSGTGTVLFNEDIGTYSYNVNVSKLGCVSASGTFNLSCITPVSPVSPSPVISPITPNPVTPVVVNCDITISNINIVCNNSNSATVTVTANSTSGKTLRYGILGFVNYQTSNVFNLVNSDTNGYTFIVAELNNETNCNATQNRIVNCLNPVSPISPVTPTTPVCDLRITEVNVNCAGVNNGTVIVSTYNPNNYTLQYQIDNYILWQNSNVFTGMTNGVTYTVRARNANNVSCTDSVNNVIVDCQSVPTTPVSVICDIVINNINIQCNGTDNATVIVSASSSSGKILKYGILGYVGYQTSNTFTLVNSDSNGYTFIVAEAGNEADCNVRTNRLVNCVTPVPTTPTPVAIPTPVSPVPTPVTAPVTTPVSSCDLTVSSVDVVCNAPDNATLTVNVLNPNNYTLEYEIDNYIPWQDSNIFTGITNGSTYILRARNKSNTSCVAFIDNIIVNCTATPVPTPVAPSPIACACTTLVIPTVSYFPVEYERDSSDGLSNILSVQVPFDLNSNQSGCNNAGTSYELRIYNGSTLLDTVNNNTPFTITRQFTSYKEVTVLKSLTEIRVELDVVCAFGGSNLSTSKTYTINNRPLPGTECYHNVNFTVTYDSSHLSDSTAIVYKKCGSTEFEIIMDGGSSVVLGHNQSYTLTDCALVGSIQPVSGSVTITINSSVPGC